MPKQLDHVNRAHAVLSASSSKQWLHCPPSARLQERFPNESSVFAEEGTFMHEVCEYKIRHGYLHERMKKPQSEQFYTEEVEQVTDIYAQFVIETIEDMKRSGSEPLVLVEERLDYSHIAPGGFGTGDMVIIGKAEDGNGLLHVIDFKGGSGVYVDCDHNSQMMLYALGALRAYGYIYPIEMIRMTIVQPRMENISTFECTRADLEAWGESIKPVAKLAYEGKGEQAAGDWCRFCRAKQVCKACMEEALSLCQGEFLDLDEGAFSGSPRDSPDGAAQEPAQSVTASLPVFRQPGLVPITKLAEVLPTLNRISSWIEAVFAFVSSEAINHAVPIPGYKVVEGRSKRVFTDTKAVVNTAVAHGFTDLYKQQLITLTEFEKMMGKKQFNELLGSYVVKPPGKLTLVPEDDPRDAVVLDKVPDQEFSVLTED